MLQVPNPTRYQGIVIAKRKADEPATDEPIVYAYARIIQRRRPVPASEVVLGLAEDKDRVTRYQSMALDLQKCFWKYEMCVEESSCS